MKRYILFGLFSCLAYLSQAQPSNALVYAGYGGLIGNQYASEPFYIGTDAESFEIAIRVNGDSMCRLKKVYADNMSGVTQLAFTKGFSFNDLLYDRSFASAFFTISTAGLTPGSTQLTLEFDNTDISPITIPIVWTLSFSMGGELTITPEGMVKALYPTNIAFLGSPDPAVVVPHKILKIDIEGKLKSDVAWTTNLSSLNISNQTKYYRMKITRTEGIAYSDILRHKGEDSKTYTRTVPYVLERTYLSADSLQYVEDITYKDRFNRKRQETAVEGSPFFEDFVQVYCYGVFGRQEQAFLPFVYENDYSGSFITKATLASNWSAYGSAEQAYAFVRTDYDNSPLDRMVRQTAPGAAWQVGDKGISTAYIFNSANQVIRWELDGKGLPVKTGWYEANTIQGVRTTDEDGLVEESYTGSRGQPLLDVQVNGSEHLETYYVYDDFGFLRYILPPEGCRASSVTSAILDQYAFVYSYDSWGRMIEKKLPGCAPIYMVYDSSDRLVLSQDGNQRQSDLWNYTFYDNQNREIESGRVILAGKSHAQLLNEVRYIVPYLSNERPIAHRYMVYDSYAATANVTALPFKVISGYDATYHEQTAGLLTSIKTRITGTESWLTTTNYYDSHCRLIHSVSDNIFGQKSRVYNRYDFVGNLLKQRESHESNTSRTDIFEIIHTYDRRGRRLNSTTTLNDGTAATIRYEYDKLGRLTGKYYGNLREVLSYNIRGWLTGKQSAAFGMKLRYESPQGGSTARYNGNISEWEWQHGTTPSLMYGFIYDGANRLVESVQKQKNGTIWNMYPANNRESGISYDRNGNIKTLERMANGAIKHDFIYSYTGNQLTTLSDHITNTTGTYTYDKNGNMLTDGRLALNFEYNSLNLVNRVTSGSALKSAYTWLADGTKLRVADASGNGFYYLGSLTYQQSNGGLQLETADFGDGVIRPSVNDSQEIHYFLRDHLGSVRSVVDDSKTVIEHNDYYPFGGCLPLYGHLSSNRYKYNGKEEQTTGGLGYLDCGARMYDAGLGRWFGVDPLGEKYYSQSSYTYCGNNPVLFIDPDGMEIRRNEDGNISITGDDIYRYWGNLLLLFGGQTPWDNFNQALEMAAASDDNRFLNLGATAEVTGTSLLRLLMGEKQDFTGFWGTFEFLWTGGHIGGVKYNNDGYIIGMSSKMGIAPTPGMRGVGKYLKGLGRVGENFHRAGKGGKSIKKMILDIVGKRTYERIVGGNPNIVKGKDGIIYLKGNGVFKGKELKTDLFYEDFF